MGSWLLIILLSKGYGQYDFMFHDFSSERSCQNAIGVIKTMKHDDITASCIPK